MSNDSHYSCSPLRGSILDSAKPLRQQPHAKCLDLRARFAQSGKLDLRQGHRWRGSPAAAWSSFQHAHLPQLRHRPITRRGGFAPAEEKRKDIGFFMRLRFPPSEIASRSRIPSEYPLSTTPIEKTPPMIKIAITVGTTRREGVGGAVAAGFTKKHGSARRQLWACRPSRCESASAGRVHLKVAELERAPRFYRGALPN